MKKIFIGLIGIGIVLLIILGVLLLIGNRHIEKSIVINAPQEVVWEEFTNLENHKTWNPFITNFSGDLEVGNVIAVTIKPPNEDAVDFNPVLLVVDENKELRWLGKVGGVPFILDGEHIFILETAGDNQTKFIQKENLSGILVPFFGSIWDNTEIGFDDMNKALKERVESNIKEGIEEETEEQEDN